MVTGRVSGVARVVNVRLVMGLISPEVLVDKIVYS